MDTKIQPRLDFSVDHNDLSGADLSVRGSDLSAADLSAADLSAADLSATSSTDLATTSDSGAPDFAVPDAGADDMAAPIPHDLAPEPDLLPPRICDLAGGAPTRLWFAGVGADNNPLVASFHPTNGWQSATVQSPHAAAEISLALLNGFPLLAQKSSNFDVEVSLYDSCANQFPEPSQIFAAATTLNRPSLLGGSAADLVFRGQVASDERLYHSHSSDGITWSQPVGQNNFLTTLNPAAVVYRSALHAVFTGTDGASFGYLYDGTVLDSGTGGSAVEIGAHSQLSNQPPAAITDGSGRMVVLWAQTDTNFEWFARETDGTTITGPALLCSGACFIGGPLPPVLGLNAAGNVMVAWSGGDENVYTSTLSGSSWATPLLASGSCGTGDCHSTLPPALSAGLGGDDAELVFVRNSDGKASHARMVSGAWQAPTAFTSTNLLTQPALATSP